MDHTAAMGVLDGVGQRPDPFRREFSVDRRLLLLQPLDQGWPLTERRRDIANRIIGANLVNRYDVRVVDQGRRFRFAGKRRRSSRDTTLSAAGLSGLPAGPELRRSLKRPPRNLPGQAPFECGSGQSSPDNRPSLGGRPESGGYRSDRSHDLADSTREVWCTRWLDRANGQPIATAGAWLRIGDRADGSNPPHPSARGRGWFLHNRPEGKRVLPRRARAGHRSLVSNHSSRSLLIARNQSFRAASPERSICRPISRNGNLSQFRSRMTC